MDYKERIEAAKEQLKAADAVEYKLPDSAHAIRTAVYAIYPELRESEDEKIRKWIIGVLSTYEHDRDLRNAAIAWLEKQGEQKPPIEKLPSEMKTIGESLGFTTQEECDEYNKMVSELIMSDEEDYNNIDPHFGKPINKVKPKFKVGDWITDGQLICKVLSVLSKSYELHLYNDDYCHFETDVWSVDKHYHLWTIKDAKDGNVLTAIGFHSNCTFIFKGLDTWKFDAIGDRAVATGHCCLTATSDSIEFCMGGPDCIEVGSVKPATKIQRELLFTKMKEAGYEWDDEKKELKKTYSLDDEVPFNAYDSELVEDTYFIPYGYHAEIEGNKVLIKKGKQKPTDEEMKTLLRTEYEKGRADAFAQMQKEWSEEDERNIKALESILYYDKKLPKDLYLRLNDWLKSLRPQNRWKPSDEQMEALYEETQKSDRIRDVRIVSLYNDLERLLKI